MLPVLFRYDTMDLLQNICTDYHDKTAEYTEKTKIYIENWNKYNLQDEFSTGMVDTLNR